MKLRSASSAVGAPPIPAHHRVACGIVGSSSPITAWSITALIRADFVWNVKYTVCAATPARWATAAIVVPW